MSQTASEAPPRQAPHPYEPIRALLQAARTTKPSSNRARLSSPGRTIWSCHVISCSTRSFRSANGCRRLLSSRIESKRPNDARLEKSLVVTLSNMKRYDEAIAQAHRYIVRYGEDLTIIDVLKVAHFYTGKVDDAVHYGRRGIELRDAAASRPPRAGVLCEPVSRRWANRDLVFVLRQCAVLRLRRHDESGPEPDHPSGPGAAGSMSTPTVPRACAAFLPTTAPTCGGSKTNIPASACSAFPGDQRSGGRPLPGARPRRAAFDRRGRAGAAWIDSAIRSTRCATTCCITS